MATDTACKHAKSVDRARRLFDAHGLYLEVSPTGGKYWRLKHRFNDKEREAIGTGRLSGHLVAPGAQAGRERARDLLRAGTDPGVAKRRRREQNKLKNAQVRYRELTGWACPAQGGPRSKQLTPEQKATDREARLVISSELGAAREAVTAIYLSR